MFDKLYKEANDEIPLNTVLMEQLKAEASKSRKKSYSGFIYRYGYAAAAIVLVAVSANVLPKITEEPNVNQPIPAVIRSIEKEPAVTDIIENDISVNQERTSKAVPEKSRQVISGSADKKEQLKKSTPKVDTEKHDSSDQAATSNMVESQPKEDAKSSRMIDHEPSVAMYNQAEELTFPEYLEKLGFSYSEAELPEGLILTGENTVCYDAEVDSDQDSYNLHYQGEGKSMSITFYAESEPVREMIDSMGKSTQNCVFEEKGENECNVYMIKEEKGLIIESAGIERQELENFANSIN